MLLEHIVLCMGQRPAVTFSLGVLCMHSFGYTMASSVVYLSNAKEVLVFLVQRWHTQAATQARQLIPLVR